MYILKKITIYVCLLIYSNHIACNGQNFSFYNRVIQSVKDICIVSLGANCQNPTLLKEINMRFEAYPFDWVESEDIQGLIDLINNNFKDYLAFENLIPYKHGYYNRIQDRQYKINLVHEFSFQGNDTFSFSHKNDYLRGMHILKIEYTAIFEKYQRRIQRFRNLTKNYKTIVFIRTLFVDKESAINLYNALINLFGTTSNIILLVLNDTEEFKTDWGIPKIKNFYLPTTQLINAGYGQQYGTILEKILS